MIYDDLKYEKLSRQRKYQIRKKKEGKCITCGEEAVTANHCAFHAKDHSRRALIRYHAKKKEKAAAAKSKGMKIQPEK